MGQITDLKEFVRLWQGSLTAADVAASLGVGVSEGTARYAAKRLRSLGVPLKKMQKGWLSKLSRRELKELRELAVGTPSPETEDQ